jgi:phosphoglycolate phosphatase
VTSKPRRYAIPIVEALGLTGCFALIEAPESDSEQEAKAITIRRALSKLTARPAVMVGDRHHDIDGACVNGIPALGVLWGIGSRHELAEAGAAALVDEPGSLLPAVGQLIDAAAGHK